jgi:hypothetical protein
MPRAKISRFTFGTRDIGLSALVLEFNSKRVALCNIEFLALINLIVRFLGSYNFQ